MYKRVARQGKDLPQLQDLEKAHVIHPWLAALTARVNRMAAREVQRIHGELGFRLPAHHGERPICIGNGEVERTVCIGKGKWSAQYAIGKGKWSSSGAPGWLELHFALRPYLVVALRL